MQGCFVYVAVVVKVLCWKCMRQYSGVGGCGGVSDSCDLNGSGKE